MAQAANENLTPFHAETLYLTGGGDGRPLLVPVVKATFEIGPGGALSLAAEQAPLWPAGVSWGDPATASYRYEPETTALKLGTDVVLVGHAHAPARGTREMRVALRVGPVGKEVRVLGDRAWFKSLGRISMTAPVAFDRIPLRYERAFGGWDRSDPAPANHRKEARNPVGTGFHASRRYFEDGARLPNLEDLTHPLRDFGQVVPPACFGFCSPEWMPRAAFAGTYDEAWLRDRNPLLPEDFNPRFFNAASPGLIAPGHLIGNEPVTVVGASPESRLDFALPGVRAPSVRVARVARDDVAVATRLDTVIVDLDERRLFLLWRGLLTLEDGPQEVRTVEFTAEAPAPPPPRRSRAT